MKRLTWTAFVAFWASALTIVALGALAPEPVGAVDGEPDGKLQIHPLFLPWCTG